jgi:hypothetical protein
MQQDVERSRIILNLLDSVERDGKQSQRNRASEFGIAVGMVNAYLKFCVKKGFVKIRRFPARRYSYLLTPKGFAEKSRLTIMHLSNSLSFFRQVRTDCARMFAEAAGLGWKRVVLAGTTEVAEISTLCALEAELTIVGIVDPTCESNTFMGLAVYPSFAAAGKFDGVMITAIAGAVQTYEDTIAAHGEARVLAPAFLRLTSTRLDAAVVERASS